MGSLLWKGCWTMLTRRQEAHAHGVCEERVADFSAHDRNVTLLVSLAESKGEERLSATGEEPLRAQLLGRPLSVH